MITNDRPDLMTSYRRPSRGPVGWLLDLFSNVWLGIALAVLLFVYCSIGSATPQVRQHPMLEMTEFEWFHWWPFNVLVVLFTATLTITTIRRIPLRLTNAGVWMIHTGIITLTLGSYVYFTAKVEGDAPVFRRQVVIEHPGLQEPARLVALPGGQTQVLVGPDRWRFQVQSTNNEWPILSPGHEGEKAYSVNVMVQPPIGEPFVRQLLADYPQFTEDVLPGRGRAINAIGRKLVDEELKLSLELEPQKYFHVMHTWALYVRRVGEREWVERPIKRLPRYHERIGSRELVFLDPHYDVKPRTLDVPVPPAPGGDALSSASVRISGYLRHARMDRRWREGGDRLNPVLELTLISDHARDEKLTLHALHPNHQEGLNGNIRFMWLDNADQIAELSRDARPTIQIDMPEADVSLSVPITPEAVAGPDGPFTPLGETGFAYRIRNLHDNLVLPDNARTVSIAMVDIRTPEGDFTRMIADQPAMTRDMHGGSADPHAGASDPRPPDPRLVTVYRPGSAPVVFAAHPGGLHYLFSGPGGHTVDQTVRVGETVEVVPGLRIRADALRLRAVPEEKPFVVPPQQRRKDDHENYAMIRLEVQTARGLESRWVQFNHYAFPAVEYAYGGRFAYLPERFRLADGSEVEVMFSRQRRPLPHPIALDHFELDTHIGGYTGMVSTIRNYVSELRFLDGGRWTEDTYPIAVNNPTEYGGLWYFQSMWDKPQAQDPQGGMNFTGLGVGNRHGVYVQLFGCCLSVAGMIFAFYVKPVIRRRRRPPPGGHAQEAEPMQREITEAPVLAAR